MNKEQSAAKIQKRILNSLSPLRGVMTAGDWIINGGAA